MKPVRAPALVVCALIGLAACAGLLGIRDRPERGFEHRAHAIAGISCVRCHGRVASAGAGDAIDLPASATCLQCHREPHDRSPCGTCHGRDADRHAVAQAKQHLVFSHADHAGTTQGHCTRCHEAVLLRDGPLRPTMATCLSCHEHREQWAQRSCSPCHRDLEDEHARPHSHVAHGDDFLARHGTAAANARDLCASCHAESSCAQCHGLTVAALPSTLHFEQANRPDMHAAGFFARHSLEARSDPALCTTCHRAEEDCRDCHRERGLVQATATHASPHPAGWLDPRGGGPGREARRDPVACASCHGGAGESLCVGCHRVGGPGGNPHPPGFRSHKRASELPCRLCHAEAP